jgi:hypothetical protein
VYSWFKYRKRKLAEHEQFNNIGHRFRNGIRDYITTFYNSIFALLFNSAKRHNFCIHCHFTDCYRYYRNYHFFITQYITNNKERKNRVEEHYNRLEVFDKWLRLCVTKTNMREGLPPSFVLSYVDICSQLKSPDRFTQAKLHLQHKDYKNANDLLNKIINDERDYNDKVAAFSSQINHRIINIVNEKTLPETNDPDEPPYYSIDSIRMYLQAEFGRHSSLNIDKYDEKFVKLHRQDDNTATIAVGVSEDIQTLRDKIENVLRPEIIKTLSELVERETQIDNTYEEFRTEIKAIKIDIEEHNFKGKCINRYCNSRFK